MLGLAVWTFFYGFQLVIQPEFLKIIFLKLQYLGILSIPASLLSFALKYSGSIRRMHLSGIILISLEPLVMFILILTNEYHHLFWASHNKVIHGSTIYLSNEFGIFLWINVMYSYILIFMATVLLLLTAWKKSSMFRLQSTMLTVGILIPWFTNIVSTFYKDLFSPFDITIIGFLLTGISIHMAMIKFNLLDITPIARDYMMDRMANPVIVLDHEGRMVEANKAAIGHLNIPYNKAIGQVLSRNHTNKDDVFSHLQELTSEKHILKLGNGRSERYYEVEKTPVAEMISKNDHFMIIIKDITEQKKMEMELLRSREDLEERVRSRTKELENLNISLRNEINQRIEAQERTGKESKRAELYLDLLGHDIGNINQVLYGWVQIIKHKFKENRELIQYANILEDTLLRSINLAKDIQLIHRIEDTGPRRYPMNLGILLDNSLNEARSLLPNKSFRVVRSENGGNLEVLGEPVLEKAVTNIIHNAVRVQKNMEPVVEINVRDHRENVRIEIADHGPGVSDDYKKEMLERGLKEGQKYLTGVGLILSRTLIERYKGTLHVEDRIRGDPGKGACFVITMPRT